MIRKFMTGAAVAAMMLPMAAMAGDNPFELWKQEIADSKSYAVMNSETGKAVVAEIEDGKVSILKGKKADAAIEEMKGNMPHHKEIKISEEMGGKFISGDGKVVMLKMKGEGASADMSEEEIKALLKEKGIEWTPDMEGKKVVMKRHKIEGDHEMEMSADGEHKVHKRVMVKKGDGAEKHEEHKVIVKKMGDLKEGEENVWVQKGDDHKMVVKVMKLEEGMSADDIEVDVMALLKEQGIDIDTEGENAPKIIVKKMELSEGENIDIDIDMDEAEGSKKKIKVMAMVAEDGEHEHKHKHKHKDGAAYAYKFKTMDEHDGEHKVFMRMKGVDAENAEEFIDELEGLSASQKRSMKKAMKL